RAYMGLAAVPLDTQPILLDRREMGAARDKGHIRPGLGEGGAIGTADAAGADHRNAHTILPIPGRPGFRIGRSGSRVILAMVWRAPLLGKAERDQRTRDVIEYPLQVARRSRFEETAIRRRRTVLELGIAGAIAAQADRVDNIVAVGSQVAADV